MATDFVGVREMLVLYRTRSKSRHRVMEWLRDEWEKYADPKRERIFPDEQGDAWMREGGLSNEGEWHRQVTQYWDRANVFGLDTPQGKQAVLKSICVLVDCAAAMNRVYGSLPQAGCPSGEIK